ncbi:LOW QUALITY PROTEIN: hypothetical protein NC651_017614 [Populus alba x Populus x berolinensis]|nr:LOW QUALITY PROTEIN: hypothetical protein NC651_017614 [Populus alba x Populus x berolinensis]
MDKREFVDHSHNNNQEEAPGCHAAELIEGPQFQINARNFGNKIEKQLQNIPIAKANRNDPPGSKRIWNRSSKIIEAQIPVNDHAMPLSTHGFEGDSIENSEKPVENIVRDLNKPFQFQGCLRPLRKESQKDMKSLVEYDTEEAAAKKCVKSRFFCFQMKANPSVTKPRRVVENRLVLVRVVKNIIVTVLLSTLNSAEAQSNITSTFSHFFDSSVLIPSDFKMVVPLTICPAGFIPKGSDVWYWFIRSPSYEYVIVEILFIHLQYMGISWLFKK